MANSIADKLRIKPHSTLLTLNAPVNFKKLKALFLQRSLREEQMIHRTAFPQGKVQTDLTRDKGWDCLLAEGDKLTWISLMSFDGTWSVFGFRAKNDADRKKEAKPKTAREIFNWVDPKTKEVKLPDDLASVLKKNKKGASFFDKLSFTNKKEYIEWIVTAKTEETRNERIKGTMERLGKGWKNPANR